MAWLIVWYKIRITTLKNYLLMSNLLKNQVCEVIEKGETLIYTKTQKLIMKIINLCM